MLFTELNSDVWENQKKILKTFSKKYCIGTDEVGRGCLAGPVVTAAVLFTSDKRIPVSDSKKLGKQKREKIFYEIIQSNPIVGIAFTHQSMIDKVNILNATKLAMEKSLFRCLKGLKNFIKPEDVIVCIDGNFLLTPLMDIRQISIIKGDAYVASISAASIVAKVTRDRYMSSMNRFYSGYGLDRNKGYGTKEHIMAIYNFGITPFHRKSFCRGMLNASH